MIDQIQVVAILRERQERLKRERADSLAIWESTNRTLLDNLGFTTNELTEAETALRAAAVAEYLATGKKTPAPGVEVKLFGELVYSEENALDWARGHSLALKLDKTAFEKIAKAQNGIDGVAVFRQVPKATIATDLSKVLADSLPAKG